MALGTDDVQPARHFLRALHPAANGEVLVDLRLEALGAVGRRIVLLTVDTALVDAGWVQVLRFQAHRPQLVVAGDAALIVHHALAELDVRAPAGHVRGYGDVADHLLAPLLEQVAVPGLSDDVGFASGVLRACVEHLVLDPVGAGEHLAEALGLFHAGGAHEHGPAGLDDGIDLLDQCVVLGLLVGVDVVVMIHAVHGPVRRHGRHVQLVYLEELARLGDGRARHAGQLVVKPVEVL